MTDTTIPALTRVPVSLPNPGETTVVKLTPDMLVVFQFDTTEVTFTHHGPDLVLNTPGGGVVVFEGFLSLSDTQSLPVFELLGGEQVPGEVYLFAFENMDATDDLETAAGGSVSSSGAGVYLDDDGTLYRGLTGLGTQGDPDGRGGRFLSAAQFHDYLSTQGGESSNPPVVNGHLTLHMGEDGYDSDTGTTGPLIIRDTDILSLVSDPDPGAVVGVTSLSVSGGTLTQIAAGVWTFMPDQDFNGDISVDFTVSDGIYSVGGDGTIAVAPVNDAPALTFEDAGDNTVTAVDVAENTAAGTVIATAAGTDPDAGDTLTYSISDPDSPFAINATTGEITIRDAAAFDFEGSAPTSVDVTVTDAGGLTSTQTLTVNVTNVNEGPATP